MIDISVSSLVKSFELGKNILDGLSFTVNSGERVGILGHNGCGKTTLFRILVGEIGYDEGEVAIAPSKRPHLTDTRLPRGLDGRAGAARRAPAYLRRRRAHERA